MRKRLWLILVVAILIASIPVIIALTRQGHQPSNGGTADIPTGTLAILSMAEGTVFVMEAGTDTWMEAQIGMSLDVRDAVWSANTSRAEITFMDGSTIQLQAGTQVEIASLNITSTGSKAIGLKQAIGTTISRVEQLVDSASKYEIETPAGVAAVRGSVMIVYVAEGCETWITNQEGSMAGIAQGVELWIPVGRVCLIICGQPPVLIPLGDGGDGGGGGGDTDGGGGDAGGGGNGGGGNNGGGGDGPAPASADLALSKLGDSNQVNPGSNIVYTLLVTNNGPATSTGAVLIDALPSSVDFVSATNDGTYDPGSHTVSWAIGRLARDSSLSVNVTVSVTTSTSPTIITNRAVVVANGRDSYQSNNTAAADTTIGTGTVNRPPVAVDDSAVTDEDNAVSVAAPGVLSNDSDPDAGDTLSVIAVDTSGTIGLITAWNANGSFTYDPNGQFEHLKAGDSAIDSFSYTVSDGKGGTDTATVTITISGVNDVPTGISLDGTSVAEGQPSGTAVGTFSTADPDIGDTFAYSLVSGEGDDDNSSFTIANNKLLTAAVFDFQTKNSYSIRVRTTDSASFYYETTFIITSTNANHPPVAVDDSATTPEGTAVTINVLANDYDIDGDTLTVESVTQGTHGSVISNGGDVTYTPDSGFSGSDSFTYAVSDGWGGTDTAVVTVSVSAVKTLTRLNIQIDTGPTASIYIWDDTANSWAIDEVTQKPVDGTNHVTSAIIRVAGGHYYYVWVRAPDVVHHVKVLPKEWAITSAPVGSDEAAYGYAAPDRLYAIHFSAK